jgi:hypothetical protein
MVERRDAMGSGHEVRDAVAGRMKDLGDIDVEGIRRTVGASAGDLGESVQEMAKSARRLAGQEDSNRTMPMLLGVLIVVGIALFLGRARLVEMAMGTGERSSGNRWSAARWDYQG